MKQNFMPIILMAITTGFGANAIKPKLNSGNVLPKGKHIVKIISVEPVGAEESDMFKRDSDEHQLKVFCKNAEGIVTVYLNDRGYKRVKELTAADIPTDLNYKLLNTTKTEFNKMTLAQQIATAFTQTNEKHAVRKDTMERLLSEEHTIEAQEITANFIACAGIEEGDYKTEAELCKILVNKHVGVNLVEKEYNDKVSIRVKGAYLPKASEIEAMMA